MYEKTRSPEYFGEIETQLRLSLQPVRPREAFVGHLQQRLNTQPSMTVDHHNSVLALVLIALALMSGLLLVIGLRLASGSNRD